MDDNEWIDWVIPVILIFASNDSIGTVSVNGHTQLRIIIRDSNRI